MKKLLPLTLLALSILLAYNILTVSHDWGDDFAAYILQAVSITQGDISGFLVHNSFTMQESTRFFGPDAYPWGFPLLLAPFTLACGPLNMFCLKFINLIFYALFLFVFHKFLLRRLPALESTLLLAVFALSPVLLAHEDQVVSDIPFLFFSTLALLLIEDTISISNPLGNPRKNIFLGIALFFAYFVRTNGIILPATLFASQIFLHIQSRTRSGPDWKRILSIGLIPYYIFAALTIASLIIFPSGEGSHFARLTSLTLQKLSDNLSGYFVLAAGFFDSLPHNQVIYGILLPFIIGGAALRFKEDFHIIFYVLISYVLFILWPEWQGIRFIFPLLPFLIYFALRGMLATSFALTEQFQRIGLWLTRGFWSIIVLVFALTSYGLASDNLANARQLDDSPFEPIAAEMFNFINTNTPPDSVILFYKPRAMRLITSRDALMIETCDALERGDYLVIRKKRGAVDQVLPETAATCNAALTMTQVFENKRYVIYQIFPQ